MTKYILTARGSKGPIYWTETQESPVNGHWAMNKKKATQFSSIGNATRYAKKYLLKNKGFLPYTDNEITTEMKET